MTFLAFSLAGCAGMTPNECRVANWFDLGERDGLLGNPAPRIDTYANQCGQQDVQQAAREQYLQGWWTGNAEFRHRTAGSESS
jgi:hypothetical protein